MIVDEQRPLLEPLDPDLSTLSPGITWRTSQLAYAFLLLFASRTPRIEKFLRRYHAVHPQFAYFIGELFGRLYQKQTPPVEKPSETLIARLSHTLHGLLEETTSYGPLRESCNQDPLMARVSLLALLDAVDALKLPSTGPEQKEDRSEGGQQGSGSDDEKQQGRDWGALQQWIDKHSKPGESRAAARKALEDAAQRGSQDAASTQAAFCNTFGSQASDVFTGDQGGALEFQDVLMKNWTLQKIVELLGRWRASIVKAQEDSFIPAPTQVQGVENTSNLRDLTPASRALLSNEKTRKMMLLQIIKGQALGYRRGELEGLAQGGVHLLVDCSGSMGGRRLMEAMAFAGAISVLCARQSREVRMHVFNVSAHPIPLDFRSPSKTASSLEAISRLSANGGTDLNAPLRAFLNQDASFRAKSDVVLISDGCGPVSPTLLQEVTRQARLTYLVVEGGEVSGALKEAADEVVIGVNLLKGDPKVAGAAARVLRGR